MRSLKPTYTQFPFGTRACSARTTIFIYATAFTKTAPSRASLIETPVLWLGRLCIFYALLKAGLAGSHANPLVSELKISDGNDSADLGFSKWTHAILEKPGLIELFSFWDIGNYYGVQLLDASVTKYQDYGTFNVFAFDSLM
nr:uncharacterized protein LOC112795161 isoform X4 [Arachis hypogaea]